MVHFVWSSSFGRQSTRKYDKFISKQKLWYVHITISSSVHYPFTAQIIYLSYDGICLHKSNLNRSQFIHTFTDSLPTIFHFFFDDPIIFAEQNSFIYLYSNNWIQSTDLLEWSKHYFIRFGFAWQKPYDFGWVHCTSYGQLALFKPFSLQKNSTWNENKC